MNDLHKVRTKAQIEINSDSIEVSISMVGFPPGMTAIAASNDMEFTRTVTESILNFLGSHSVRTDVKAHIASQTPIDVEAVEREINHRDKSLS